MKLKLYGAINIGILLIMSSSLYAGILLKDKSEIVGTWLLESVAPALDSPKVKENRTWEFRDDGKLITSGYNRHFGTRDSQEWSYRIENGKIVADWPGRPGKTMDYAVHEKTKDSMILQGGLEGFYFFRKQ
jgi:hypothetical protein